MNLANVRQIITRAAADQLPASNADVWNEWEFPPAPPIRLHDLMLVHTSTIISTFCFMLRTHYR